MTKAISSYPESERKAVIERRLRTKSGGSGYLAALKAAEKLGIPVPNKQGAGRPRRERDKREKKPLRRRPAHKNTARIVR